VQPLYVIGSIDVSWRPKVVTGDERRRQGMQALVRDRVPGAATHDDGMAAIARIGRSDDRPRAHTPGREDAGDRLGSEVRPVGEADNRRLDVSAESREPAAKRRAPPVLPFGTLDDAGVVGIELVGARDDDDLVHRARREPLEDARKKDFLFRAAEARSRSCGENDGSDHLRENRRMSTAATAPIRYAKSGDVNIAYQVTGDGALDLVLVSGFTSLRSFFTWIDPDQILDEVEEFLTGVRRVAETDRVLATVLFTDLVGSTERLRVLGDRAWADLLQAHQADVRRELERFGGEEIDTAGDGFLAIFDGPARAIRCAQPVHDAATSLELEVRAGVHTGEIERVDGAARGIAVHVAARVASEAGSGEVLVTATTRDLVAGSGLEFEDRGEHALKGIEEARRLYAAV
jgi:class 3 adenylate cyclase